VDSHAREGTTLATDAVAVLSADDDERDLRARQALLVKCLGALFQYATERGYELTLGEGRIQKLRPARNGEFFQDGVHMENSLHYIGLAQDVNLFVREGHEFVYVKDGASFAWTDLGGFWESLDPLCAWGGRFRSKDSNHLSIRWQGRA
jgi:hypothetical protein